MTPLSFHPKFLSSHMKSRALTTVSLAALAVAMPVGLSGPAYAADAGPQSAQAPQVEEIVVTGSRIIRNGYEAPTPVAVLGAQELTNMAPENIADAVNRMPAFSRSTVLTNGPANDVTAGVSNLNLRGLQATRTLVLLDGKRVVGDSLVGFANNGSAVDINIMPDGLISRVDVVTGGASAVYGSDALAGVVNFVLDKKFTGVKGNIQGGVTTHGDDEQYALSLTTGVPFANDRGHFLLSLEDHYQAGVPHANRPYNERNLAIVPNPAYAAGSGLPQYITIDNMGLATATRGGLIVSGPLKGTMFTAGGAPQTFNYGSIVSSQYMSGGDWRLSRIDQDNSLDYRAYRQNAYTRMSYDVTENINAFFELGWAYTKARTIVGVPFFHLGNVTVKSGNPYIPASVQARMTALGLTQFALGTTNIDEPPYAAFNGRTFRRYVAGLEGKTDAFGTQWTWDASYARSTTHVSTRTPNDEISANYNRAVDAVVDPATGQIVCRVITGDIYGRPCVPYNPMGIGVNSKAALDYISSTAYSWIALAQDVFQANATGEPFSTWAGPVSVALGAEHRYESVDSDSTPIDQARGFFASNYTASHGRYSVNEGAVEVVVPLAKDTVWARSLDLNGAVRATDYSTSGYVTTWKIGGTWKPIDDITVRATQSRDIRAPNLGDLFSAGRSGTGTVTDKNGVTSVIVTRVGANPNLQPEKANETGLGVVLQPRFFPGFGASVDYYNIKINGAIVSLAAQNYVDLCNAGQTSFCSFIQRDGNGVINFVAVLPANFQVQQAKGIDFEASYTANLEDWSSSLAGSLSLRGVANYVKSIKTVGLGITTEGAGVVADAAGVGTAGLFAPKWKYMFTATYKLDAATVGVTYRGIGAGVYNNAFVTCTTGCPAPSATAIPVAFANHTPGGAVWDLNGGYKILNDTSELFFVVQNVFDTPPPYIAGPSTSSYYSGQGNTEFDRVGRIFRAGVRFKY